MNRRSFGSRAAICAAVLVLFAGCASAPTTRAQPSFSEKEREAYVASFDQVWSTIRDRYWDPEMGGLDWDGVRNELRPKMERVTSRREARGILREAIARIGLTHFGILTGDAAGELEEERGARGSANPGIDVRVIDGQALVTSVAPDSTAASHGVRPGWIVLSVDGRDLGGPLAALGNEFASSTIKDLTLADTVLARLEGPEGSRCRAVFLDGEEREVALDLERTTPRGEPSTFGHFPTVYVWFESRDLAGGKVGYIAFNFFMDPMRLMSAFEDAIGEFADRQGIVIDLRGNPGGIGGMSMGLAGWFVEQQGLLLGTMHTRQAPVKFIVNPRVGRYAGPLAILVDGLSASTSEIFAGGLKDIGRARIFGTRTAGAALPSVIERLPTGEIFQYAIADYISAGGDHLEGVGVAPDEVVRTTREALLAGRDPALEAAVAWIEEQG